jgi:hypothetical protein
MAATGWKPHSVRLPQRAASEEEAASGEVLEARR